MSRRPVKRQKRKISVVDTSLWIDRLGAGGQGLAGEVAVPFTLPGEEVRARQELIGNFFLLRLSALSALRLLVSTSVSRWTIAGAAKPSIWI